MRVLLVEDQAKLAATVAEGLRRQGMAVDVSLDGGDAAGGACALRKPPGSKPQCARQKHIDGRADLPVQAPGAIPG